MQRLTDQAWQKVLELSQRYNVSTDAVTTMLQAVSNGGGTMAQFFHSELGGGGQWMQGGMTMVGDMFNHGLKNKVDGLCSELSQLLQQQPFVPTPPPAPRPAFQNSGGQSQSQGGSGQWQSGQQQGSGNASFYVGGSSGSWWPAELGSPNGSGSQNNIRYAYFSNARRLAVDIGGRVTVYDTLDNQIGGVSQQQGVGGSVTLTSQYGTIDVATLPVISVNGQPPQNAPQQNQQQQPAPLNNPPPFVPNSHSNNNGNGSGTTSDQEADIFAKIERLAGLQQKGMITQDEYATKKSELLSRL